MWQISKTITNTFSQPTSTDQCICRHNPNNSLTQSHTVSRTHTHTKRKLQRACLCSRPIKGQKKCQPEHICVSVHPHSEAAEIVTSGFFFLCVCKFHLSFPSITLYICSFLYFFSSLRTDIYSSAGSYTAEELSSHRSNNLSEVQLVGK